MKQHGVIKQFSGQIVTKKHPEIARLKEGYYFFHENSSIGGDAPKDFISVYDYREGRKRKTQSWSKYIAKIGHKSYPTESITEHLITRIGQVLNFKMAESRLMRVNGQVRFLSKFFLKKHDELLHGAEIFSAHLGEMDLSFVNQIEAEKISPSMFTFDFIRSAINAVFPTNAHSILEGFVKMLALDAIVGNNDQHHYNWGVINDIRGVRKPRFSPIYDTARALFWNLTEERLNKLCLHPTTKKWHPKNVQTLVESYSKRTMPWTGSTADTRLGHFELLEHILQKCPEFKSTLLEHSGHEPVKVLEPILDKEFDGLISNVRKAAMLECLIFRMNRYNEIVEGEDYASQFQES
jgi:HipA-like C-terminal domain